MIPELTTYDVDEAGISLLRLNRPDVRNAMNTAMLEHCADEDDFKRRKPRPKVFGDCSGGGHGGELGQRPLSQEHLPDRAEDLVADDRNTRLRREKYGTEH